MGGGPPEELLAAAQAAERSILAALLRALPELGGRATVSLPTALRAQAVSGLVDGQQLRGLPLIQFLEWISDAATAARHLSLPIVEEAVQLLVATAALKEVDDRAGDVQHPMKDIVDEKEKEKGKESLIFRSKRVSFRSNRVSFGAWGGCSTLLFLVLRPICEL